MLDAGLCQGKQLSGTGESRECELVNTMQKTLSLPSVQLVETMCVSDRDTCRATGSPEYQLMGKEQHVPVLSQLCRQM